MPFQASKASSIYVLADVGDPLEQDRLDLQHQIWYLTLNDKLHTTPLSAGLTKILDIGTGSGIWARSMAIVFPDAEVTATDLVLPPTREDAPSNLRFIQHNADDTQWTPFATNHFDFIFARMVTSGIRNWDTFRANIYRHLKPGGCVEITDILHPLRAAETKYDSAEASPLIRFLRLAEESWRRTGLDYSMTGKQVKGLTDAGFVDVQEQTFRWPIGGWAEGEREKKIGELARQNVWRFLGLAGKPILMNGGFMAEDEAEVVIQAAKDDLMRTEEKKFYYVLKVHTARKPANLVKASL